MAAVVIVGVDPHKLSATVEVLDGREKVLGGGRFGADRDGYRPMLAAGADRPGGACRRGNPGAGRAVAVELARAGAYVYVTGRSSRRSGRSKIGRPETIEETGELITAAAALPLMIGTGGGLLVEMTDGTNAVNARFRDGVGFYYDLVKANVGRIVLGLAAELDQFAGGVVTAVGVTPGWLRSEAMLEHFGVTEQTWRDACGAWCLSPPTISGWAAGARAPCRSRGRWFPARGLARRAARSA